VCSSDLDRNQGAGLRGNLTGHELRGDNSRDNGIRRLIPDDEIAGQLPDDKTRGDGFQTDEVNGENIPDSEIGDRVTSDSRMSVLPQSRRPSPDDLSDIRNSLNQNTPGRIDEILDARRNNSGTSKVTFCVLIAKNLRSLNDDGRTCQLTRDNQLKLGILDLFRNRKIFRNNSIVSKYLEMAQKYQNNWLISMLAPFLKCH
jgi:hypothetical protein